MKKHILPFALLIAFVSCSKKEDTAPKILLSGKSYEASFFTRDNKYKYIGNIRFLSEDTLAFRTITIFEAETIDVAQWRLNYTFDQESRAMTYGDPRWYCRYMGDSLIRYTIGNNPLDRDTVLELVYYKVK